jgi:hypothetical protein
VTIKTLLKCNAFSSEAARCKLVIFPMLREIYKRYQHQSALWVQTAFSIDEKLNGTPDYMLSYKSELAFPHDLNSLFDLATQNLTPAN